MRYVILRDDDTNTLTPTACLEQLYRPFLDQGLPVNLAVIPWVRADARSLDGQPEGFLLDQASNVSKAMPIGQNEELVAYLRGNPGYHVAQHGCHHEPAEFDTCDREEASRRFAQGASMLHGAGLGMPVTFVAPHDRLSRDGFSEAARRYRILSTGWFEWRRLPPGWWPRHLWCKLRGRRHWRMGRTLLLSHPGCLLSCHRPVGPMLDAVKQAVYSSELTVLVTHWWEYFREGRVNDAFVSVLHKTADWLAGDSDIRVISFGDLLTLPGHPLALASVGAGSGTEPQAIPVARA